MAKMKEKIRTDVTSELIWSRPPRGEPLTDTIRRVARQNPVFTEHELRARGAKYAECLPRMAASAIIKRQGTHVYSANTIDQTNTSVQYLMTVTSSRPTTPERMEKHSGKLIEAESVAAHQQRMAPSAERLASMRTPVFDTAEARSYLGGDPAEAIRKLLAKNHITAIHPGLYRRPGRAEHGPEVIEWADRRAKRDHAIAKTLDAAYRAGLRAAAATRRLEPIRITSMREFTPSGRQMRIYVNFNRLPTIYAIAGGPGKKTAIWRTDEATSGINNDVASVLATELFPTGIEWGDLIALVRTYGQAADKSQVLPAFRSNGRLDEASRRGEKEDMRLRYDHIRESDRARTIIPATCVLYVDHRDDGPIIEAVTGLTNLAVARVQLETGDFHARWGDLPGQQLYIERKTAPDFVNSIGDGRLESQIERLSALQAQGIPVYLLQQGDVFDREPTQVDSRGRPIMTNITPRAIAAMTARIALARIPTAHANNWQNAAETIIRLIKGEMERSLPPPEARPKTTACGIQDHIAAERPEDLS